ncbi:type I polyketide synthase [Streptomyces mayteni]
MSLSQENAPPVDSVAVVGMGCRLPGGAVDVEAFWDLLVSGRSGVVEVPADRWGLDGFFDPDPEAAGRSYSRHGGFVRGVREFDAALFGVPAEEAVGVDPQHRFVLEVAWEALEHAGIAPDSLRGSRTGVFVGMGGSDFERLRIASGGASAVDAYFATGSAQNMAANRLSFVLGLEGPSLVVDTACSSSLVAVHLACQALRSGECDTALVAGVNLMLSPGTTVALSQGRFLSPDGRCKTFDAAADGYVRGEGCGVVVLRRVDAAREAGQRIWSVIRGTATNQDGRSNGLTAPRGSAQEDVIRRALAVGGVRPADVGYVETHGTGTALGDPIEVRALAGVLGVGRAEAGTGPVALGSVKTNIGHLEAGAGIAGLIKAVLTVERGVVPPHPHLTRPNPYIPWDELPVTVPTEPTPWPGARRVAGVSSFGFGGTNAHVVLESPPPHRTSAEPEPEPEPARPSWPVLLKVSGRGSAAVEAGAGRLADWTREAAVDLGQLAWAAGTGRADLPDRAAVVAGTLAEAEEQLRVVAEGFTAPGVVRGRRGTGGAPRVGFVVPGQGPRLAGALAGLYGTVPEVTEVVDEVAKSVGPVTGLPLSVLLDDSDESAAALADTAVVQPALFTVAVALGRWWRSIGVRPAMVLGHSAGAYAAAVLAGVFSLEDGIRLICARARLMGDLPPVGAMAAVFCAAEELADVEVIRSGEVVIASYNGPRETVVSGPTRAVLALLDEMAEREVRSVRLRVSYASHGPLMEPVLGPLGAAFEQVTLQRPTTEFVSDSTGELAGPEVATVDYWVRHTRRPVRFSQAMRTMLDRRIGVVIELGPGGLLPLFLSVAGERAPVCAPSVVIEGGVPRGLLESAGRVWAAGVDIDWARVNGPRPAGPSPLLPGYPFQRQAYWPELADAVTAGRPAAGPAPEPAGTPPPAPDRPALQERGRRDERDDARRVAALVAYLRGGLADVMELGEGDELDADSGLFDLGLTSAMVVKLRARFERDLGRRVPTTAVFEHPTIKRLARYLADMGAAPAEAPETSTAPGVAAEPTPAPPADTAEATDAAEPIAIIGMACRFPGGANDLDGYWRVLREGLDTTSTVPAGRWDGYRDATSGPALDGFRGGFLDVPVDAFDAEAFGITPREARGMDPQQRLMLEVAWEALEDAGYRATDLEGSTASVFVGMTTLDYLQLLSADPTSEADAYHATGNTFSVAAGRLSYFLGAQGPSMAVDTACSSSLVTTHLAIRSLRAGESDLSIVAGVNLMLSPTTTASLANLGALSSDGRCRTFDAAADGYARGEGAGVVILKRLRDAEADGDHVWAVLRGSAVNQDGRSAGLTVPNGQAQQRVIREALRDARTEAGSVSYVEAHGTGTALGDPIEIDALMEVMRPSDGARAAALRVGSVKTNLGHLEAAAGVAGLIKVALALHHGEIPAHLHLDEPSPHIAWDELPLEIPTESAAWHSEGPRIAGLSAFGFGGTNAHVVLTEAPRAAETTAEPAADRPSLLVLSARSRPAATALAERYRELLAPGRPAGEAVGWPTVAFHAATRRTHLPERIAVTASSAAEAAELLAVAARGEERRGVSAGRVVPEDRRRLVLAFSGQGSQWAGMGVDLLDEPTAGAVLRRCDELVRELAGWSLLDELRAPAGSSRLDDTVIAQPGIFAVQAALTDLWRSWGVVPDVLVGHSVGEVAAAYAAGALDLAGAVEVVVRRGEVMASTRGSGAMVAMGLSEAAAAELIEPYADALSLAAVNGPESVVVAGDPAALAELEPVVRGRRAHWARIQAEYAFHSPRMLPARSELLRALDGLTPAPSTTPVCSTVTGEPAGPGAFDAGYWAENLVRPVRFADALRAAAVPGAHHVVLEVGPHAVLGSAALQTLGDRDAAVTAVASQRARRDGRATLLAAAGRLHVLGYELDHRALHAAESAGPPAGGRRVALPGYPWQRRSYWLPRPPAPVAAPGPAGVVDVEDELADAGYAFRWQAAAGQDAGAVASAAGDWLLVADRGGVAQRIAARLTAGGGRCVVVAPEKLDPTAPDTARELLSGTDALRGIVHCGALDADRPTAPGPETEAALALSCGPLLTAARVLRGAGSTPRVWVVTRGATGAGGGAVAPLQSPVWGLGRVVALEQPELWGGLIDLDPAGDDRAAEADAVVAEVLGSPGAEGEDQIAHRAGGRLVARLGRAERLAPAASSPVGGSATYLITGGRGALGLRVAEWLVGRGARHLVLTGRRPLPEDGNDPVVAAVRRLREAGATVHTPAVDVADPEGMAALFAPEAPWPAIRGVVHAAGTFNPCATAELDWDRFRAMTRAKVDGTLVLDALTRDVDLDFLVMFGSASAVWGSALAGHYAAANGFLDAMAHHRAAQGLPGLAVDWGWWAGSDLVAGEHLDHFEAMGLHVLPDRVGFAALERLLGSEVRQLTVAPVDWARFRPVLEARRRRPLLELLGGTRESATADEALLRRLREAGGAARTRLLEERLRVEVSAVLGLDDEQPRLDRESGFSDAGMDSVMSVELKNRLDRILGLALPATAAFEHPSIAALAEHLLTVLPLAGDADPPPPEEAGVEGDDGIEGVEGDLAAELDGLSEAELLELLGQELEQPPSSTDSPLEAS